MTWRRLSSPAALRLLLGLAASALVLWLILRVIMRGTDVSSLKACASPWALAAVLCVTLQIALVALRWAFFARELGAPLEYSAALAAYYVSAFLNQLLPLGMLGDVVRGVWHARRFAPAGTSQDGARPALDAATALIMDRASGQLALIALVLPVLPLWWRPISSELRGARPELGSALLLGSSFVAALLGTAFWYFRRSALRHAARARRAFFRPGALAVHGACSLAALLMHVAAYACTAKALGLALPFGLALRVIPLVLVASTLPSFALGTGAREASAAALYHLLGLRAAEGVAIALGLGVLGFIASFPGLLVLLSLRRGPS